ncbi:MAG: MFS transporter [Anaerovoracaceae bacterium]
MEKIREQKNTIIVCVITAFITTFMGSALNLSIPDLEKEFGVGAQTVGWVVTIYMLTCSALAVPFGRLADRVDRVLILRTGILIFSAGSLSAVISRSMGMFLLFRLMQGIGASMIFSTNIAILAAAFDEKERGRVLGYATCATYAGLSAGPVIGGILNQHFGWRAIFLVTASITAVAFCGAVLKLPKGSGMEYSSSEKVKPVTDYAGNILFVMSMVMSMYGLSAFKNNVLAPFILVAGLFLFIIFIRTEKRVANPVVDIRMFCSNLPFTLSCFAATVNYGSNFAISYLMSIYLQLVKGMSSQWTGIVLAVSTVIMAILSPWVGRLSDRVSPNRISAAGMAFCAVALGLFTFVRKDSSLTQTIITLALSGLGFALFSTPNTNAVMSCVKKEDYGTASSILSTMRSLGHTASMSAVTAISGIYMGSDSMGEAPQEMLMKTLHVSFAIFTFLCILGIFMAAKRKV